MKWVFTAATAVIVLTLFFAFKFGMKPRPQPLINPTEVKNLKEAGVLVYRRLRQDVRSVPTLAAGSLPMIPDYQNFWQGFILGAQNDGAKFHKILTIPGMSLFQEASIIPTEVTSLEAFQNWVPQTNEKTFLYLPTTEVTHINKNGLIKSFESRKQRTYAITLHKFFASKKQLSQQSLSCEDINSASMLQQLDCLAEQVTRSQFRKKLDTNKNYIALYRYGIADYVAFWYQGSH
ncbi:MAG: hypothetical protein KDD34_06650 [Bdellovibrionales bacterium]|nr:hypothetical protein [Bdellovibrionales bacterium]